MTSIERTAYPRFRRAPTVRELREIYTPTLTDGLCCKKESCSVNSLSHIVCNKGNNLLS
jgi:hypothetical protein